MTTLRKTARALIVPAIAAMLFASDAAGADARQSDRGTAGMNQGSNCVAQGGHATVYIDETGANGPVSYVWCEFPDGSGWTCANGDWGTSCESWLVVGGDQGGPRGGRFDVAVSVDLLVADPVVEPVTSRSPRVEVETAGSVGELAPMEEDE